MHIYVKKYQIWSHGTVWEWSNKSSFQGADFTAVVTAVLLAAVISLKYVHCAAFIYTHCGELWQQGKSLRIWLLHYTCNQPLLASFIIICVRFFKWAFVSLLDTLIDIDKTVSELEWVWLQKFITRVLSLPNHKIIYMWKSIKMPCDQLTINGSCSVFFRSVICHMLPDSVHHMVNLIYILS